MPHALILPLQRVNAALLPAAPGEYAHAAFFTLLACADPALAERLHGLDERKPFTLHLPPEPRRPAPRVGDTHALRLTFLDDGLFPVLAGALLTGGLQEGLRIGDAQFLLTGLLTTEGAHPMAGCATYPALWNAAKPEPTVAIRFRTSTVFRAQKNDVLFPEPRLVWQSWGKAWQGCAGEQAAALPLERLLEVAATRIRVQRYRLQTHLFPLKGGAQAGFVGTCVYDLRDVDEADCQMLNALADCAFYAGTGRKTAMGMGQTQRLPLNSPTEPR